MPRNGGKAHRIHSSALRFRLFSQAFQSFGKSRKPSENRNLRTASFPYGSIEKLHSSKASVRCKLLIFCLRYRRLP
ncbi:hypothetical protein HMPREF0860_0375 [Treponema socranskii subsp. socranskii VPI DR56BR1116 = ATCC 35536]|uniref:Uncharacterized protein n=1 Tax=Treponema socranskii subsp. socranskii VPI DR56BR1116 = ATCC 35536 TaxID=1125725 RepID=U2M7D2_TRESO|nr:hypothetical protein HMPREF1325_2589 [Treponema socranskii subsp. socranskii VPI DR56BR1116 = ATCC 35536]ERJ97649.1 hypothetical protein HMPREF0860_0375 [Treponema socranskii subsp. socranskii VPI DR56BR1116 = ATCC 35536]